MKKLGFALLITMFVFQLAVPIYVIADKKITLSHAMEYKFLAKTYDPHDVLQGRYLRLNVRLDIPRSKIPKEHIENIDVSALTENYPNKVFAILSKDENGFAKIAEIKNNKSKNENYVSVENQSSNKETTTIVFPFDRYYLNANIAQKLDLLIPKNRPEMVVTVAISRDNYVIKGLTLDGLSPAEYTNKYDIK